VIDGTCHSRIRIRRIRDEATRKTISDLRQEGNKAFETKQYDTAIALYEDAVHLFPTPLLVAPTQDMEELVILLSNMAECYLQLEDYHEAGQKATDALVLDNQHEKSRIRRAKVELAMGSWTSLIQARVDLKRVLDNPESTPAARVVARQLLGEVGAKYDAETRKKQLENPAWDCTSGAITVVATCR
jgi:tetratricopeptide (TPR) repeat protein